MASKVVRGPWGRGERHSLWAALWPQLETLPSPGQEGVIAAVVEEIAGLLRALKAEAIRDHAAWLRGVVEQADPGLWPPSDYQAILRVLKAKKAQLVDQLRAGQLRTGAQNRRLWAALAAHPHCDQEWLYGYIREHYPRAKRMKGGKMQPSVSMLTQREVGAIIDYLEGRGAPHRRRRSRSA
jgi:hypothetical protein